MNITWTHEQKLEVGRLAAEGLSAEDIKVIFNLKNRGAITGLAKRNPDIIQLRGNPGTHRAPREKSKEPRMPRKKKAAPIAGFLLKESSQPVVLEDCDPITLLELTEVTCHWPIGSHDYTFCGRTISSGQTYCRPHAALAYRPRS